MLISQPLPDPPRGMPLLARRVQILRSIASISLATESSTGDSRTGTFRGAGTGQASASRTTRRCTPCLRASARTPKPSCR
jgi:hypothetical protein